MSCLHVTSRSRVQAVETATDIIIRLGCVHYNLGCGPFPDPALNAGRLCTGLPIIVSTKYDISNSLYQISNVYQLIIERSQF
ncbi:hypothetical protein AHAS_Ahas09G0020500 [Arachis hypogaea]